MTLSSSSGDEIEGEEVADLQEFLLEEVLESLTSSLEETKSSKDYLSYSTLLDVYLTHSLQYSESERDQLLSRLLKDLQENPDITYEIAWDLPALIIPLVDSPDALKEGIRQSPYIVTIIKIFECLTYGGNPKEVFLKACELLSSLDSTKQPELGDEEEAFYRRVSFFNIKVHCVFELVTSSLSRIRTQYPSRFLSMAVAAMTNLLGANLTFAMIKNFVVKRIYVFAREYQSLSPPEPSVSAGLSMEAKEKLESDEAILERKLLTSLVTNAMHLSAANGITGYSYDIFSVLQSTSHQPRVNVYNYTVEDQAYDRLYDLALSFDINPEATFVEFVASSDDLLRNFDFKARGIEDELTGAILEKLVVDYQKNLSGTLIDSSATEVQNSLLGIVDMFTYYTCITRKSDHRFAVSFDDAVNVALRLIVPGMVDSRFSATCVQDVAVFWIWYSLEPSRVNDNVVAAVPTQLLHILFQALLHCCASNKTRPDFTYVVLTLLTKLLTMVDENLAYDFILDSLYHCPYEDAKIDVVGIFKLLVTTKFAEKGLPRVADSEALESLLAKTSLTGDPENIEKDSLSKEKPNAIETPDTGAGRIKPALPPRDVTPKCYLDLTQERSQDLQVLVSAITSEAFPIINEQVVLVPQKFSALQAYLNLLYLIKPILGVNFDAFMELVKVIAVKVKEVQAKHESGSQLMEVNATQMIQISVDRILEA